MSEVLRIPGIFNHGNWPLSENSKKRYSIERDGLNIYKLLQASVSDISERQGRVEDVFRSIPWMGESSLALLGSAKEAARFYHPITGAVIVGEINNSAIADFYDKPGRVGKLRGVSYNRGYRYCVGLDDEIDIDHKLSVIRDDLLDASQVLKSIEEPKTKPDFLAYTGVADYLKNHALSLFHAISYPHVPNTAHTQEEYKWIKDSSFMLACKYTRLYYSILLGRPIQHLFEELDEQIIDEASGIISADYRKRRATPFKAPEIDHPLRIMYGTYETVNRHPDASVILSLPTGGTQVGIAAHLGYEVLRNRKPKLHWVPVSLYTRNPVFNGFPDKAGLDLYLEQLGLKGQNVLVTEDNSNTGRTAQLIADSLDRVGVGSRAISIVEADPIRIMYSSEDNVANITHAEFTPIGNVPVFRSGKFGTRQMRKALAKRTIKHFKEESQHNTGWEFVRYPGRLGKKRDFIYRQWDDEFGEGNWRIGWRLPNETTLSYEEIFEEYVRSYEAYFREHSDEARNICKTYAYAYDRDEIDLEIAFDRNALIDKPGIQNQFHHVALNIALTDRLGYVFQGDKPLKVRAGRPDQPVEEWPEGHRWQPGNIPYEHPEYIREDYEIVDKWINPGSVEAFYQANKVLQVKKR